MQERHFNLSICTIVSAPLWIGAFVLVIVSITSRSGGYGQLGILLAGVAGLLNLRALILGMAWRERGAFEAGREYERSQRDAPVLELR